MNKILVLTFIVLGLFHASAADDVTLTQYAGVWYVVSYITPIREKFDTVTCYRLNVTITDIIDQKFKQEIRLLVNGNPANTVAFGRVIRSQEIRYHNPGHGTSVGTVTKYNDGDELIFHNALATEYYQLLSRSPAALAITKTAFGKIASRINLYVRDVDHGHCSYGE